MNNSHFNNKEKNMFKFVNKHQFHCKRIQFMECNVIFQTFSLFIHNYYWVKLDLLLE